MEDISDPFLQVTGPLTEVTLRPLDEDTSVSFSFSGDSLFNVEGDTCQAAAIGTGGISKGFTILIEQSNVTATAPQCMLTEGTLREVISLELPPWSMVSITRKSE